MMHVAQSPLKCKLNHSLYEPDWQRLQTTVLPLGPIYSWTLWKEQGQGVRGGEEMGLMLLSPKLNFWTYYCCIIYNE